MERLPAAKFVTRQWRLHFYQTLDLTSQWERSAVHVWCHRKWPSVANIWCFQRPHAEAQLNFGMFKSEYLQFYNDCSSKSGLILMLETIFSLKVKDSQSLKLGDLENGREGLLTPNKVQSGKSKMHSMSSVMKHSDPECPFKSFTKSR